MSLITLVEALLIVFVVIPMVLRIICISFIVLVTFCGYPELRTKEKLKLIAKIHNSFCETK
jgi:hypothetical protein